jgi:hypothetical protein
MNNYAWWWCAAIITVGMAVTFWSALPWWRKNKLGFTHLEFTSMMATVRAALTSSALATVQLSAIGQIGLRFECTQDQAIQIKSIVRKYPLKLKARSEDRGEGQFVVEYVKQNPVCPPRVGFVLLMTSALALSGGLLNLALNKK